MPGVEGVTAGSGRVLGAVKVAQYWDCRQTEYEAGA